MRSIHAKVRNRRKDAHHLNFQIPLPPYVGGSTLWKLRWICGACGERNDRDINAAKNILAAGHRRLEGGIPVL
ncbi:zinc ribbon domain-containing protein [Escherichia coli]